MAKKKVAAKKLPVKKVAKKVVKKSSTQKKVAKKTTSVKTTTATSVKKFGRTTILDHDSETVTKQVSVVPVISNPSRYKIIDDADIKTPRNSVSEKLNTNNFYSNFDKFQKDYPEYSSIFLSHLEENKNMQDPRFLYSSINQENSFETKTRTINIRWICQVYSEFQIKNFFIGHTYNASYCTITLDNYIDDTLSSIDPSFKKLPFKYTAKGKLVTNERYSI